MVWMQGSLGMVWMQGSLGMVWMQGSLGILSTRGGEPASAIRRSLAAVHNSIIRCLCVWAAHESGAVRSGGIASKLRSSIRQLCLSGTFGPGPTT